MKSNQLKLGSILAYMQMGLKLIVGIAYTPIMLRILGQNEYGLYSTVSSTVSMLSILSLGFNSGYVRYYSEYKSQDDNESIDKLNGLFLIVFSIIGLIALSCGGYLAANLNLVFDKGLSATEYITAEKLMWLLTVNMAITFPMSVFQTIISSNERFVFLKLIGILKTVINPLVALPLLLVGFRSVAMVMVTFIVSVITDIIYLIYAIMVLKVKFKFRNFQKGLFKDIFVFTFFIALNIIVNQINNNLDKFLLGRYRGTTSVAKYTVGSDLYIYFTLFSTAISNVFTPRIHRMVNETSYNVNMQRKNLTELFVKVGRIQFIVLSLISTGFLFFGKRFILYWAGEGYEESYYVALLLFFSAFVPLIQNLGIEVQRALNKHQFRSIVYMLMAAVNVVLTIFLSQRYGALGAAFGTALSLILMNGIVMNIYYHKKCNIDIFEFWKNIFRLSFGLIAPTLCGLIINKFYVINSIAEMLIGMLIYVTVYSISMWMVGINEYERKLIYNPLHRLINRK